MSKDLSSDEIRTILETMTDEQIEVVAYMSEQLRNYVELVKELHKQAGIWDDLSFAVKAMRFDLDCTRKERDDLQDEVYRLRGDGDGE
jgi:tRNA uridine 5-carbamoylmethylation protein Kti12